MKKRPLFVCYSFFDPSASENPQCTSRLGWGRFVNAVLVLQEQAHGDICMQAPRILVGPDIGARLMSQAGLFCAKGDIIKLTPIAMAACITSTA